MYMYMYMYMYVHIHVGITKYTGSGVYVHVYLHHKQIPFYGEAQRLQQLYASVSLLQLSSSQHMKT